MDKNTKDELFGIIDTIDDKNIIDDVNKSIIPDEMLEVKNNLINYLNNLITTATTKNELVIMIEDRFKELIPDLTFDQLKNLYQSLSINNNAVNEKLVMLLSNNKDNQGFLQTLNNTKINQDMHEKMFDDLSSDDVKKIDKLTKLMDFLEKQS
jgi:hypothetical protein